MNLNKRILCLGLGLLAMCSSLPAATTQGTLGHSSSRGTIGITVHIPEQTQLVATKLMPNPTDHQFCLQVMDRTHQARESFYRVSHVNQPSPAVDYEHLYTKIPAAQIMRLQNLHNGTRQIALACEPQQIFSSHPNDNHNLLIMLLAE